MKSNGSLIHLADNPEYADVIASPALLELLRLCGATDPRFTGGFLISKPGGGPPLFWHQDWWGWDDDSAYRPRAQQLFAMIYLTDTNIENGCLRVIPGSHRRDHPLHHLDTAHSEGMQGFKDPSNPAYADRSRSGGRAGQARRRPDRRCAADPRRLCQPDGGGTATADLVVHAALEFDAAPRCAHSPIRASCAATTFCRASTPQTFLDWPEPLKRRIAHLLPPDDGGVPPMRWNRIPDFAKLAA